MRQTPAQVARPRLLALALGATICAAGLAVFAMSRLHARLVSAPVTVVSESARLAEVLEEAPWTATGPEAGPVVWAMTPQSCANCAAFARDLRALASDGYRVRSILVASAAAPEPARAAALAGARDRLDAHTRLEPGEAEGLLQWGRETSRELQRVLVLNGVNASPPFLIWRRGADWIVSPGSDADRRAHLADDLKPAA